MGMVLHASFNSVEGSIFMHMKITLQRLKSNVNKSTGVILIMLMADVIISIIHDVLRITKPIRHVSKEMLNDF